MKRALSFIVVFSVILAMFSCFALFAEGAMSLDVTTKDGVLEYERGETVTLTVMIKDYVPANGIYVQGYYDQSILAHDRTRSRDFSGSLTNNDKYSAEMPYYASIVGAENGEVWDDDDNLLSDFELLRITFKVKADAPLGKTTMRFSLLKVCHVVGIGAEWYTPGTAFSTEEIEVNLDIICKHDFTDVAYAKPAEGTAMDEAEHSRVCTKCEQTVTEACAFDSKVTDPTHTEEGYTTHTCACGYVVVDSKTPAAGHNWGSYVHNETAEGQKHTHTRTCTANDGGSETADCTFGQKYTDPTCTEDGYVTYTCNDCGYSYNVVDEGSAKGHSLTVYEHLEGTTHKKSCSRANCGYSEEEACTMGEWAVTEEPTRDQTGVKTRTCIHCKEGFETAVVPKVAYFTVSNASDACGHEFEVAVSITNNPGISGTVIELAFDDTEMELIGVELGTLGADLPVLLQPANKDGDVYKVALATEGGIEGDGELLKLKFRAAASVTEGDHAITVSAVDACDSSEEMAAFEIESGEGIATLRNYILGDIDRSGTVSVADAVQLIRYLNGRDVTIEPYAAEMVLDDGAITVADAQYLLQALIGLQTL